DPMRQDCSRTEQADTLSVIDRRKPIFFVEVDFVSLDFSKVHGDTHVALAGKVAHLPVELGGDASRGARAEPDMDALVGGALPLTVHIEYAEQACLTVFYHARVHRIRLCGIGTNIHDDPGKAGTNTAFLYCLGN